jgi:AraC-like DNA-binding protein
MHFTKFEVKDLLFVEYNCPLTVDELGIWAASDYLIHVLSGQKTWRTRNESYTAKQGETLYIKKGATIIDQYFTEEFCMLGFFISDDLIRETVRGAKVTKIQNREQANNTAIFQMHNNQLLENVYSSLLGYFQNEQKPIGELIKFKAKELILNIITSGKNESLADYLKVVAEDSVPSLPHIMESNFSFNLSLEEFASMTHRSLSSFKRDFNAHYNTTPGKWLLEKRLQLAAELLRDTNDHINEVMLSSGFENASHFSKAFRDKFGNSPSAYRSV